MIIHKSSVLSLTKCAVLSLSAAVLLGASTPSYAKGTPATPIANGNATGGPISVAPDQAAMVSLQFSLVQLPDGSLNGHGKLTSDAGRVKFDLTSFMFVDGILTAAGPVTAVKGSPGFGPDSVAPFFHTVGLVSRICGLFRVQASRPWYEIGRS